MTDLLFLAAYAIGIAVAIWSARNLTWVFGALGASFAVLGAFVSFRLDLGMTWSLRSLQWTALTAIAAVAVAGWTRRGATRTVGRPRAELLAAVLPALALLALVIVSRLIAARGSGAFTAVGYLVQRVSAEDNAKWLDFTAQLITGQEIVQGVPMGGPLQLVLVVLSTALASVSTVLLGGVNEVLVAANAVVYAELLLAAAAPLALLPLVSRKGSRAAVPAPLIWAGGGVLAVTSLAASGLGHLTLQLTLIVVAFWAAAFLNPAGAPALRWMSSAAVVAVALVWFPMLPISLPLLVAGLVALVVLAVRRRRIPWVQAVIWIALAVFTWPEYASTLRYLSDTGETAALGAMASVRGVGAGARVPTLQLLSSQGGTETAGPILAALAATALIGAVWIVSRRRGMTNRRLSLAFMPMAALAVYALALAVAGTWWAGVGPEYGAMKTMFLATAVIAGVSIPLALMAIEPAIRRMTPARVAAIGAIVLLLAVDGVLPRAVLYVSPQQWPTVEAASNNYWWPAEVRTEATQSIASLPIGCAYFPRGAQVPTALPNGQLAYSCTRILAGLSGADTSALPIVNWLRREWFTNEAAWLNEYPGLSGLDETLRSKRLILMDDLNRVVGVEPLQGFLNRVKPEWAQ